MFKLNFTIFLFCVIGIINLFNLSNGRPITGFPVSENPELPAEAMISREDLITLAQYLVRTMASKINITLQATSSHTEFPRFGDISQAHSAGNTLKTTIPTIISSTYYETGNVNRMNQKSSISDTEKPKFEYQKTGVKDPGKRVFDYIVTPLIRTERPPSPEKEVNNFPNQFGFEIIPSYPSSTYLPETELKPEFLSPINRGLKDSALPIASSNRDKESPLSTSNIRLQNLTIERIESSKPESSVMSVPFEAIITFTRQKSASSSSSSSSSSSYNETKLKPEDENNDKNLIVIPTRDPPDDFPPYFETVLAVEKKKSGSKHSLLSFDGDESLTPVGDSENRLSLKPTKFMKPMIKRQTPRVGEFLEMLGISTKRSKGGRRGGSTIRTPSSSQSTTANSASRITKPRQTTTVTFEENSTTQPKEGPMFQRQEIEEEEEEEEEEGGSLGSVADLLPLVLPILEDLSDPNTETDIGELLEAGLPLVQGISQGDGETEGPDLVGIVTPVIASLSAPNRNGNGTVLQAILPLILPLVTPFIGPIVGPIIQGISNPADSGGSSITPLIQALAGPLSLPTEPGGVSIASSLISGVIASLSKDLKAGGGGGSDIGALASTLVSGILAGGSAGINAKFMKPSPSQRPAHNSYGAYGQGPVPASSVDTFELVGTSLKDILGLSLQLVKSVISSVTGILGASSMEQPRPVYGPAKLYSRI